MGEEVYLDSQSILDHYRRKTGNPSALPPISDTTYTILEVIQDYNIPSTFDWERDINEQDAKRFWRLREWIFAKVLYSMGEDSRITLHMFGSTKPTSDIDITVEAIGVSAADYIREVERQWADLTKTSTTQWAVEFYGDFLIFHDNDGKNTFINTRLFDQIRDDELLTYVGVSILRNAGTFDFQELKEILRRYPSLKMSDWKEKAQVIYDNYLSLSPEDKREAYYKYLKEAETLRDTTFSSPEEKTKAVFLALCHANIYRNENYILPSTVIHVVRDIQAGSPKPSEPETQCSAFKVKLASCALGTFTYLCSALEQLGYMHKYQDVPAKYNKYYNRYKDAMSHIVHNNNNSRVNSYPIGGKRRTQTKRRHSKRRHSKTRKLRVVLRT
jgi:hypothetical protein